MLLLLSQFRCELLTILSWYLTTLFGITVLGCSWFGYGRQQTWIGLGWLECLEWLLRMQSFVLVLGWWSEGGRGSACHMYLFPEATALLGGHEFWFLREAGGHLHLIQFIQSFEILEFCILFDSTGAASSGAWSTIHEFLTARIWFLVYLVDCLLPSIAWEFPQPKLFWIYLLLFFRKLSLRIVQVQLLHLWLRWQLPSSRISSWWFIWPCARIAHRLIFQKRVKSWYFAWLFWVPAWVVSCQPLLLQSILASILPEEGSIRVIIRLRLLWLIDRGTLILNLPWLDRFHVKPCLFTLHFRLRCLYHFFFKNIIEWSSRILDSFQLFPASRTFDDKRILLDFDWSFGALVWALWFWN